MRRANRRGARAFCVCTVCGVRRQLGWHLRLEPTHQPDVYVCKYCQPKKHDAERWKIDPEYRRNWNLQRRYGITAAEYDAMLSQQNGVCAVCGSPPRTYRLFVDHDHDTGTVRGLLCAPCNSRVEWVLKHNGSVMAYLGVGEIKPSTY